MKRYGATLTILAIIFAVSSTLLAHEECDEEAAAKVSRVEGESMSPQPQVGPNVRIKLFQYQPGRIQVKAGTTVTWVNEDEIFHTVTVGGAGKKGGGFDAPLDGKGKTFSFTFSEPGIYSYYCDRHEHMRGEIEVR